MAAAESTTHVRKCAAITAMTIANSIRRQKRDLNCFFPITIRYYNIVVAALKNGTVVSNNGHNLRKAFNRLELSHITPPILTIRLINCQQMFDTVLTGRSQNRQTVIDQ